MKIQEAYEDITRLGEFYPKSQDKFGRKKP